MQFVFFVSDMAISICVCVFQLLVAKKTIIIIEMFPPKPALIMGGIGY